MNSRIHLPTAAAASLMCMAMFPWVLQAQVLKNTDYLVMKGDEVLLVKNGQSSKLEDEMTLTPTLKLATNGVLRVNDKEKKLLEGQKLTSDGFWLASDGMLIQFEDHYMFRQNKPYFVQDGTFSPVTQNVGFPNGTQLRVDGTVITSQGMFVRLQDGQMLTSEGHTLPALDHVMVIDGRFVLQKDGSILNLPPGSWIMMSEGTKVKGDGTIIMQGGGTLVLKEGERISLEGAAMRKL